MSDNYDVPKGVDYKGPSGIARDSIWLTSEDLPHDRDTLVTIEAVVRRNNVTFQGGRKKLVMLSLKFVGKTRELGLNATNRKTLMALFHSNECAAWYGKRIKLFIQQGVRKPPDNTEGPAVRIRAERIPDQAEPAAPVDNPLETDAPAPFDSPEDAAAAIAAVKSDAKLDFIDMRMRASNFAEEEATQLAALIENRYAELKN
jgi:hypothetical protein